MANKNPETITKLDHKTESKIESEVEKTVENKILDKVIGFAEPNDPDLTRKVIIDVILIFLAVTSVILVGFEFFAELNAHQIELIHQLDIYIAGIFLAEFVYRLAKAKDSKQFFRQYWWELIASIPLTNGVVELLRPIRIFRVVRLVELLRVVRLAVRVRVIFDESKRFSQHTFILEAMMVLTAVSLIGAIFFNFFEAGINPNVSGIWDSIWWSVVTITTIGYGDIVPVTSEGRIVAIVLMLVGTGTVSFITARVASYLIRHKS
ncbi:potassium channel family protein [Candidatus Saccharibacteria bacterium]|nr:potassium channel family protein [Candidatus Saccharibacteria bacterium]MCB9835082.1 potassium channel family protein [Candidatus Nomurabacteria bacterium]